MGVEKGTADEGHGRRFLIAGSRKINEGREKKVKLDPGRFVIWVLEKGKGVSLGGSIKVKAVYFATVQDKLLVGRSVYDVAQGR